MQKRWVDPRPVTIPKALSGALDLHPLVLEMLVRRGVTDPEAAKAFLDPELYRPAPPSDLPDMEKSVTRLQKAITNRHKILVWGDFDVDGQTATALLVSALEILEAKVTYYIPDRNSEGHGIHTGKLGKLLDDGIHVVVTCDTGIAAHDSVEYAQGRGVDVIITDHHQLAKTLPDAHASVNPQRLPEDHPLRTLPGVGVAYKLVEALFIEAGIEDRLAQFLDLVALGIVADVAEQTGDTRYLLQRGLKVLQETSRLGLKTLIEQAEIDTATLDEETIGFQIGPRLNALGRLDDANIAVALLTTDDVERARILANRVEGLNAQRKMQTEQVFRAAQDIVEREPHLLDYAALVLGHERWPGGIIGIVANRLVEHYNRPVILFNIQEDGIARGSARSVPGVDITEAISQHAKLLLTFGGHTMAAGLSLHTEHIRDFRHRLSRTIESMLPDARTIPTLPIAAYVSLQQIDDALLQAQSMLKPFGPGNPPLTLAARRLLLTGSQQIGRTRDHLRLTVADEAGNTHEIVWWRAEPDRLPPGRFDLAFTLGENVYKDKRELQLTFVDVRPIDEEPEEFAHRGDVEIVDYRALPRNEQEARLRSLESDTLIWADGDAPDGVDCVRRDGLRRAKTLAIWTAPPGLDDLHEALEAVNPGRVLLFGVNPGSDSVQGFIQRFGGLVKHALNNKDGKTSIPALCGAMAHSPATIYAALDWMLARGHIRVVSDDAGQLSLAADGEESRDDFAQTTAALAQHIQETAAFRSHFRKAEAETLIGI